MKKFLSILLCFVCVLSFTFPVSAFSFDDNALNGVELDAMRFVANMSGKSEVEIANEFLMSLGMDEELVANIPDSKKIEIADSNSIKWKKICSKIDSSGNEIVLTKEVFNDELTSIKENSNTYSENSTSQRGSVPDNGLHLFNEDDYLIKNMYIYETKNAPSGTFGIVLTYEWKTYSARWQGEEVIGIAGDTIAFDRSSFYFLGTYAYSMTTGVGTSVGQEYVEVTPDNLEDYNDLKTKDNAITYQFNLKSNVFSPIAPKIYTKATFIMIASSRVLYPNLEQEFNIWASYFHQKVGLGSAGVSVDITGSSISVTPSLIYTECYLSTEGKIYYNPN